MIRKDLEQQGPAAVERRLVEDNFLRRQLGQLDKARCIEALYQLYVPDADPLKRRPRPALRELIGKGLGISGRTVDRYLRVLETPLEVQAAFSEGKLSLVETGKVAGLSPDEQEQIAAQIVAGAEARSVVKSFLKGAKGPVTSGKQRYRKFLRRIQQALSMIPQPLHELSINVASESTVELMSRAIDLLSNVKQWEELALSRQPPPDAELVARYSKTQPDPLEARE